MQKLFKNLVLSFVLILSAAVPTYAQDEVSDEVTISQAAFAAEVIDLLRSQYTDRAFEYDPEQDEIDVTIISDNSSGGHLYLGNIYNQLKFSSQAERILFVKEFYDESYSEDKLSADEIKSNLLLRLRMPAEMSNRKIYLGADFESDTRISGGFEIEIVLDSSRAVASMNSEKFSESGLKWADAFDIARKNLAKLPKQEWIEEGNIYVSSVQDDYDCARLVVLGDLPKNVDIKDVVAFMPSHSVCIITDKPSAQNIMTIIGFGEEMTENQRHISQALYVYRNGNWVMWKPEPSHPAYEAVFVQHLMHTAFEYNEQKQVLDEHIKNGGGSDVFPASIMLFETDEGDIVSLAVIPEGVESLIPKTENYVFIQQRGSDAWVTDKIPFDEVEQLFKKAGITPKSGLMPIRYDVTGAAREVLEKLASKNFNFEKVEE